jgi:hypothetical protein
MDTVLSREELLNLWTGILTVSNIIYQPSLTNVVILNCNFNRLLSCLSPIEILIEVCSSMINIVCIIPKFISSAYSWTSPIPVPKGETTFGLSDKSDRA